MGRHHRKERFDEQRRSPMLVKKEQAHAIRRVLDPTSKEVVGWLYEWNTGQVGIMWKSGPRADVIYA